MPQEYKYDLVLLVDDNYIDNIIHQRILQATHFARQILSFEVPQLAIQYLEQHQDNPKKIPQVIFLDVRMPEIDGFAFLKKLESMSTIHRDQLKVYMLSSSLDPHDRKQLENHPLAKLFISKPLTEEVICKL